MLAPDGRPVPGAMLYYTPAIGFRWRPYQWHESATTGPDGRFRFLADRRPEISMGNEKFRPERTVVTAAARDYGVAWVEIPPDGRCDDLTLQLVEDRPITGRILDLEGKPVPGATLQVLEIRAAAGEDLGPWLEAARAKRGMSDQLEQQYLPRFTNAPTPEGLHRCRRAFPDSPASVATASSWRNSTARPSPASISISCRVRPSLSPWSDSSSLPDRSRPRLTTGRASGMRPPRPSRSSAWCAMRTRRSRWPGSRSPASRWPMT